MPIFIFPKFTKRSLFCLLGILLTLLVHLAAQRSVTSQELFLQHDSHYNVNPVGELPTITIEQGGLTAPYPDWRRITFSRLGGIAEGGELISNPSWDRAVGYSLSRSWNAGDSPAQFLKLGDFQDSLGELTLDYILENSLTEIDSIPLSTFGMIENMTINDLVEAIPELRNLRVRDVEPILALVGSNYSSVRIENLLNSRLGNKSFDELDLSEFTLDDIPNLSSTELSEFENWQNTFVDQVPGLWDLALGYVFGLVSGADIRITPGLIGIVDIAFGTAESKVSNTITGSYQEGFEVSCSEDCAHAELGNWSLGKQWISGKYQDVRGGFGVLSAVNGGKEPTGRHPFGNIFKVVVWDIEEPEGKVDTALFFRYCQRFPIDLGCTPYFLGPVPFFGYHEKDTMFLGLINPINISSGSAPPEPLVVPPVEEPPPIPQNSQTLINPLPGAYVTSEFGYRNLGLKGASTFHSGIDLAYSFNDSRYPGQIVAAADGVVAYADNDNSGCGALIWLDHLNGLRTGYCHMSEIYVRRGQSVSQGQVIALVGNRGVSSNPHLHFIVYEKKVRKVNPRKYVKF